MKIVDLVEHLATDEWVVKAIQQYNKLMDENPTMTFNQIAQKMGLSPGSLKYYISAATQSGQRIAKRPTKTSRPTPLREGSIDQMLMNLYDPSLTDEQLLSNLKATSGEFEKTDLDDLLAALKRLALSRKLKVRRKNPPASFIGKRHTGYSNSDDHLTPDRFYDPIFTPSVNMMIKLARSGWSNEEIADEVNGREYDDEEHRKTAPLGQRATTNSVSVTLGIAKNVFGIDIPEVERITDVTNRGGNIKGSIVKLKKENKSISQIASALIDDRMVDSVDLPAVKKLVSIYLSQLRKTYRMALEKELGRRASSAEINQVVPHWLKIETSR